MELAALDLNLLLVLHVVLEEGSVARAARRLHVTPPAVSNSLARLRALLGDPLLVRSGRGLSPTPRALELAPVLARIVEGAEQVLHGGDRDPASSTREMTIALTDADQVANLPPLAKAMSRRMPRARLHVISVDALISKGGLEEGAADAFIGPEQLSAGLHAAPLYEEDAVLVVRRGHPALKRPMSHETIQALRHVDVHLALGRGGAGHRVAEDALTRHGFARDIAVIVPTFTAAALVAASTDLAAGLPRRLATRLAPMAKLVMLPLPGLRFRMQLVWHERTDADPVARFFRDVIVETLREPAQGSPRSKRARRQS